MKSTRYIAICSNGHGAGKTTFARLLSNALNFSSPRFAVVRSFAEPIKEMLSSVVPDISDKGSEPVCFCGKKVRELLQTLGTEWGRQCVGEDLWVNLFWQRNSDTDADWVIVDDMRFLNEYRFMKDHDAITVFIQSDRVQSDSHLSEGQITPSMCDVVIFNNLSNSMERLKFTADDFVFRTVTSPAPKKGQL